MTGQGAAREHALASIEDTDETHLFFSYDARGRLSGQSRDGGAEPVTYEYGSAGAVTVTDASGAKTLLLFDQDGRLRQVRDALDQRSSFDYDGSGDLVAYVSPTGLSWTYDRDSRGNVVRTLDPLGNELRMTYDAAFGGLTSLTDAKGNTTNYGYDATGDLRSITYPNGSQEQFEYDPLGNLSESVNRRGRAIDYQYDARGLLTKKTYADGSAIDFTYDARGNLKTAVDASGTISLDYDTADRLTKINYPGGRFLEFTYDAGGRRTRSVDQDGYTVNYAYDAAGRLSMLTDGGGATVVEYAYDTVGRLSRKDLGNDTFTTYEYDATGQLLSLVNQAPGGVNSSFEYTYDAEGRRTSVTTADGTTTYEHDATGQLTNVALPGGRTIEYVYDAAGNRVSVTDGGVTTQYATNNLNQYVQIGATSYTYDADGNLVGKTDGTSFTGYTFDDENRLVGSTGPDGVWSYEYDPFGDRTASIHDALRTDYLVDPVGLGDVVAEYGADGLIAHYTHGLGLVSRTAAGGSSAYFDFDATGNTVGLTGAAGAYINRYSYLPFGETTVIVAAVENPFTFAGEWGVMDAGGGLDFMRTRFFDPASGSFVSDDPLGINGGDANFRRYVRNATVSLVDPSGLYTHVTTNLGYDWYIYEPNEVLPNGEYGMQMMKPGDAAATNGNISVFRDGMNGFNNPGYRWHEMQHVNDNRRFGPNKTREEELWREARAYTQGYNHANDPLTKAVHKKGLDFVRRKDPSLFGKKMGTLPSIGPNVLTWEDIIRFFGSFDPNDIAGPAGAGTQHFVTPATTLPYTIRFENAPNLATAPAQEVFVTHQFDADLDWSSVELDDLGFGSITVDVPDGLQSYKKRVAYRNQDGSDLFVDVDASFDLTTGLLTWILRSVDPLTGVLPEGVFDGFLPVNDETHRGEGFVRYLVRSKALLTTATTIDQQASIVFDVNAPIETNVFTNTIDAGTPSSSVNPLPTTVLTTDFPVSWSGSDDAGGPAGSGIASFDVFVSDNGGPFQLFRDDTTATSAMFTGERGHTYGFFSVATDNVGFRQPTPASAQAATTVFAPDTTGPTIDRIDLVRDARGKKVLRIVLTFSENLNEAGAETLANYVLETRRRRRAKPIALGPAVYDAGTVTLTPLKAISAKKLATVFLTVRATGTLTDASSNLNLLDGDRNGVPGGDFVRSLSQAAILSVVDELLESGELSGRRGLSESLESSLY